MTLSRKLLATIFGTVFTLIGLLGFFNDPVLSLFDVDTIHNFVHLITGIAGLVYGMQNNDTAKRYGQIFGAIYGLVTLMGFVMGEGKLLGLMSINNADNYLHLFLSAGLIYLGYFMTSDEVKTV